MQIRFFSTLCYANAGIATSQGESEGSESMVLSLHLVFRIKVTPSLEHQFVKA